MYSKTTRYILNHPYTDIPQGSYLGFLRPGKQREIERWRDAPKETRQPSDYSTNSPPLMIKEIDSIPIRNGKTDCKLKSLKLEYDASERQRKTKRAWPSQRTQLEARFHSLTDSCEIFCMGTFWYGWGRANKKEKGGGAATSTRLSQIKLQLGVSSFETNTKLYRERFNYNATIFVNLID